MNQEEGYSLKEFIEKEFAVLNQHVADIETKIDNITNSHIRQGERIGDLEKRFATNEFKTNSLWGVLTVVFVGMGSLIGYLLSKILEVIEKAGGF